MGVAFSTPSPNMFAFLLLACFLSAAQASGHEQVHVSGSTGPTVVASGHAPVYAPHYYGLGHAPVYPTSSYPRYPYSYVPVAATHGYGNVNHATATHYIYSRYPADIHYGEQDRQGYSSYYAPTSVSPYYRYPYSYVPAAATHGYGNVIHSTGTPYMYSRYPADIHYGEQDRQGYSSYAPSYVSPYYRYPYSYVPAAYPRIRKCKPCHSHPLHVQSLPC